MIRLAPTLLDSGGQSGQRNRLLRLERKDRNGPFANEYGRSSVQDRALVVGEAMTSVDA